MMMLAMTVGVTTAIAVVVHLARFGLPSAGRHIEGTGTELGRPVSP
ncbi:hypothetical protein [Aromatoleum buckelii]|nr:hypothetical protein [Aromatoleum buckelii]MCK0512961.1 hypothetical protein [Aromatoleum buckelii]